MPVLNCFKVISSIVLSARMRLLLRSASGIGAQSIDTKERREIGLSLGSKLLPELLRAMIPCVLAPPEVYQTVVLDQQR